MNSEREKRKLTARGYLCCSRDAFMWSMCVVSGNKGTGDSVAWDRGDINVTVLSILNNVCALSSYIHSFIHLFIHTFAMTTHDSTGPIPKPSS